MTTVARLNRLFCPLCGERIRVWHTSQFHQTESDAIVVTTRWAAGVAQLGVAHEHDGEPEPYGDGMSHYCKGVDQSDELVMQGPPS
jgi:hypothetical protein